MLKWYRCVILSYFGWLALCGAKPPDQHVEASKSANNTHSTAAPSPTPAATETRFRAYNGYDPDPCYHAKDHDTADLCAQWRAAIASEKAVREAMRATSWSIVATILSAVGLGFLLWSLRQTEGALGEARRGNRITMKANARATRQAVSASLDTEKALSIAERNAVAAARQADIAEDTARRTLRAYVSYDHTDVVRHRDSRTEEWDLLHFSVFWKNNGNTPAYLSKSFIGCTFVASGKSPYYPAMPEHETKGIVIAANGVVPLSTPDITKSDVLKIAKGEGRFFVVCRFGYVDIFDQYWLEDSCEEVFFAEAAATNLPDHVLGGTFITKRLAGCKEEPRDDWNYMSTDNQENRKK